MRYSKILLLMTAVWMLFLISGCAEGTGGYNTRRDHTARGAGIGAAVGALAAILDGKREADDVLARAAIGAALGAGVGAYMDAQEERLTRIPGTQVERVDEDTLLINFQSDILFDVDSAALDNEARNALSQVASVISEYRRTAVIVQGHTDSTGSEEHNEALSVRRANSVKTHLTGRGIDAQRMVAIGYGESMPVASNDRAEGRRLNRRVDILLKAKAR